MSHLELIRILTQKFFGEDQLNTLTKFHTLTFQVRPVKKAPFRWILIFISQPYAFRMFLICSLQMSDSKTVFFLLLSSLIISREVIFLGSNRDFNGKWGLKVNILKKTLSDGPSADLRPLYNCNVAKVSIIMWSQISISTSGSTISGIPKISNNVLVLCFSGHLCEKVTFRLSNGYLNLPIYLCKICDCCDSSDSSDNSDSSGREKKFCHNFFFP